MWRHIQPDPYDKPLYTGPGARYSAVKRSAPKGKKKAPKRRAVSRGDDEPLYTGPGAGPNSERAAAKKMLAAYRKKYRGKANAAHHIAADRRRTAKQTATSVKSYSPFRQDWPGVDTKRKYQTGRGLPRRNAKGQFIKG